MKILKIELQNINSLKSETPMVIDFNEPHFKDVGLYAITGTTGSGKTTILDAITIALYNKVPRFNKSNIKAGLIDIVSYGASDALARLTFESQQNVYEVHWAIRIKSKTGKVLSKPVEQVRLKNLTTEKIIGEKKGEIQNKIIEITQLNYEQFLRSVLLAQGEFAAFLSATNKEKGNLLEQITGEEIYKKIGETLVERISLERKTLEQIKASINTEDLLSTEELSKIESNLNTHASKKAELSKQINETEKQVQWYYKLKEYNSKKEQIEKSTIEFDAKKIQLKASEEKIERHELAQPVSKLIFEEQTKTELLNTLNNKENALKNMLSSHAQTKTALEEKHELAKTKLAKHLAEENIWNSKLEKVTKLDTQLNFAHKQLQEVSSKHKTLTKQAENLDIKGKNLSNAVKTQRQALEQQAKFLKEHAKVSEMDGLFTNWVSGLRNRKTESEYLIEKQKQRDHLQIELPKLSSIIETETNLIKKKEEIVNQTESELKLLNDLNLEAKLNTNEKENKALERTFQHWKEIKTIYTDYLDKTEQKQQFINQEKGFKNALSTLEQNILTQEKQLKLLNTSYLDAVTLLDQSKLIVNFEEERQKLQSGKPCALCGSEQHPFVLHYSIPELSTLEKQLEERKTILDKETQQKTKLDNEVIILKEKLKNAQIRIQEFDVIIDKHLKTSETLQIELSALKLEDINEKLKKIIGQTEVSTSQINVLKVQIQNKTSLTISLSKQKEELNTIEKQVTVRIEKQKHLKQQIQQLTSDIHLKLEQVKTLELELTTSFNPFLLQLPILEQTEPFLKDVYNQINRYKQTLETYKTTKNDIEKLEIESKNLETEQKNCKKEFEQLKINQDELKVAIETTQKERNILLPQHLSVQQKQMALTDHQNQLRQSEKLAFDTLNTQIKQAIEFTKELEIVNKRTKDEHAICENLKQDIDKKIDESLFENKHEVLKHVLDEEILLAEKKSISTIQTLWTELETLKKENSQNIKVHETQKTFGFTEQESLETLERVKLNWAELMEEMGKQKNAIENHQKIVNRNSETVKKINLQEKELNKWNTLLMVLGGSKHAFNTYVQRLTLKNLIQLANIHLLKLNKRYTLEMDALMKPNEELNFKLIDHYQTNKARYVDTCSGGEKFIISLALALGLSDLSSNHVSIKSLFIDEGFGTLDQSTLETVISTLETLQAQGKMIGIISHVENLKERISTQIQVSKTSNGISKIKIV
ncbi:MAG: SbcC/MukB-like Walker B domain-containing protein [Flavobacteriales bacterium]